jgi:hypothetical protein
VASTASERASAAAAAALAAGLAVLRVGNAADAAHDAGVARAMGLDAAGGARGALDAALAGLFAWAPVGTLAARAALGQAAALGAAALALHAIGRRLLAGCAEAPRVGPVVAAIATGCAAFGPAWQLEGAAAGGSVLGALLAIAPLWVIAGADEGAGVSAGAGAGARWGLALLLLGLAIGEDPLAGLVSVAACVVMVGLGPVARARWTAAWDARWRELVACALAGLVPLVVTLARARAAGGSILDALIGGAAAERGASATGAPWGFVQRELGGVMIALAVGGAVLALLVARARPLAAGLATTAVLGLACGWAGAALGPTRYGAPVLAATGAACLLAGVSMQALVRVIAGARLPLARASAAMVLVLELVAPVDAADEALRRASTRARGGGVLPEAPEPAWDDAAWGALPPRALVLVTDAGIWRRASAARATGALRGDLAVVPTFARGALAAPFLARDVALVPLWRDLALAGAPSEETLSSLASARPLVTAFEPAWGRVLGKHLVPAGLFDRFEPEPRGTSDRRRALEAFAGKRERLARAVVRDPELADAAAILLRQRVLDVAASGDRDLVGVAVADLDAFAPGDATGAQVVAKLVTRPRP